MARLCRIAHTVLKVWREMTRSPCNGVVHGHRRVADVDNDKRMNFLNAVDQSKVNENYRVLIAVGNSFQFLKGQRVLRGPRKPELAGGVNSFQGIRAEWCAVAESAEFSFRHVQVETRQHDA